MPEHDDTVQDDLGPLIRRGYAVRPPRAAFAESLGRALQRELKSSSPAAAAAADPSAERAARRPLAAWLAAHWRLGTVAACVLVAMFVVPLALHRRAGGPARARPEADATVRRPGGGPAKQPAGGDPGAPSRLAAVGRHRFTRAETGSARQAPRRPGGQAQIDAALVAFGAPEARALGPPPAPPRTFRAVVPAHLPREGLVGLWLGDGNAFDSAGSHHGVPVGVTYTADRHGKPNAALHFSGTSGRVAIRDHAQLDTDDAFSLSAWIKPRAHGSKRGYEGQIVSKWEFDTRRSGDYILGLCRSGHLKLWVAHRESTYVQDSLPSRTVVPTGRWSHVAATFDRGKMKLYVNGALDAEKVAANVRHTSRREYTHDDVYIGAKWNDDFNFNGAVDEVAIWGRALTAEEIAAVSQSIAPDMPYIRRMAGADQILLSDGGRLLGTILNERYAVATCFGRIEIPAARVAGMAGREKGSARVRLVLTDGQVLAGKLGEPILRLKLSTGSTLRVPVNRVRRCGYRISKAPPAAGAPAGAVVTLRSGDRLVLADVDLKLRLLPAGLAKELDLPLQSVMRVDSADPKGGAHRVTFVNGSTLTGELLPKKLPLKLRLGRDLTIDREMLRRLVLPGLPVRPSGQATLLLRSGDRLVGRIAGKNLTVRTEFGDARLPLASLLTAAFEENQPGTVAVRQWDGVVLHGRLVEQTVTISVAPDGPTLSVPATQIVSIAQASALPPPELAGQVEMLVTQLGAESYRDREAATEALAAMGPRIIPLLRKHFDNSDVEVRQRIEGILEQLGASPNPGPATTNKHPRGTPALPHGERGAARRSLPVQ